MILHVTPPDLSDTPPISFDGPSDDAFCEPQPDQLFTDPLSGVKTSVLIEDADAYRPRKKGWHPNTKIDERKLVQYLKEGRTQAWIARRFGCSRVSVNHKIARLKSTTVANVAPVAGHVIAREIRTIDQLCKINRTANALLDSLETTVETVEIDPITGVETRNTTKTIDQPAIALKAMAEIRKQLEFQLGIFQSLADVKAIKEFQDTVLEVLGQEAPEIRDKVVKALVSKNAMRAALEFKQ